MPDIDALNELVDNALKVFPQRLKQLRIKYNVTQLDVAKAANISDRAYRSLESGASIPKMDTILLIARYFKVTVDYLVGFDD